MSKYWSFITLIIAAFLLFFQTGVKEYTVYSKVLGLCLCMFSLYKISKPLPKKDAEEKNEQDNLKF